LIEQPRAPKAFLDHTESTILLHEIIGGFERRIVKAGVLVMIFADVALHRAGTIARPVGSFCAAQGCTGHALPRPQKLSLTCES